MFGFIPADKVEIFQSTPSSQKETLLVINAPLIVPSFQSTPSSQRETIQSRHTTPLVYHFNPLPPRRGRRYTAGTPRLAFIISIHSLLAEGDAKTVLPVVGTGIFQSTPSSQRETIETIWMNYEPLHFNPLPLRRGRLQGIFPTQDYIHFNPLPLRRGRRPGLSF